MLPCPAPHALASILQLRHSYVVPFYFVDGSLREGGQHAVEDAALLEACALDHLYECSRLIHIHVLDADVPMGVNRYFHICFLLKASR